MKFFFGAKQVQQEHLTLKAFLLFFVFTSYFSLCSNGFAKTSQEAAQTAKASEESQAQIDTVVETLNETLTENRALRDESKKTKEELKTAQVERGVLESQIRRLMKETERGKVDAGERVKTLEKQVGGLTQTIDGLKKETESHQKIRDEAEEKLTKIQDENQKVRGLLNHAILESERDSYIKLINEAKKRSHEAMEKIHSLGAESEYLKNELSRAHYNLGNIMFRSKMVDEAITHYERALELNPSDPWIHHNLGVLYDYYQKNDEAAMLHYREYLRLKPVEEEANEVRTRLLDRELSQYVVPPEPLKFEFQKSDRRTYETPRDSSSPSSPS